MGKLYVIYRDRGSTESCHDAEQLLHQSLQHITDSEFIHADISNYAEIFNRILQENDEGGLLIVDAGDRFAADYVEKLWHVLKNSNAAYISGRKSFIWMDKTVANKLLLCKKQLEMMPYTDILAGTLVNIKMAKGLALQGHLGGDMEADFLMRLAMKHTVEIQELLDYEYSQPDASQFQCYQGVYFKEWYFESMTDFLIPLLSDGYMTDTLHLDLPTYPSAYMAVITLFLTGVAMGIAGWFGDKEKRRWETDLVFLLSVGALGCLVYYMNRPSYHNLDCISLSAVLLAAYLAQYGMDFVRKNGWENIARSTFYEAMRGGIGLICAASVLAMGTGNVLQFSQNSQIKENFHNTAEFEDFAQQVAAVVPANTHAFGLNVAEVYSMLHWSTQCFTMDFSDMAVRPDSLKELKEQLETEDAPAVFTNKSSLGIWQRNDLETYQWFCDTYKLNNRFSFYNEEFRYFTKR